MTLNIHVMIHQCTSEHIIYAHGEIFIIRLDVVELMYGLVLCFHHSYEKLLWMLSAVQMSLGSTVIACTVTMKFNRRGKKAVTLNRRDNGLILLLEKRAYFLDERFLVMLRSYK